MVVDLKKRKIEKEGFIYPESPTCPRRRGGHIPVKPIQMVNAIGCTYDFKETLRKSNTRKRLKVLNFFVVYGNYLRGDSFIQ